MEEKNKYGMLAQNFNRSTNVAMEHNGYGYIFRFATRTYQLAT